MKLFANLNHNSSNQELTKMKPTDNTSYDTSIYKGQELKKFRALWNSNVQDDVKQKAKDAMWKNIQGNITKTYNNDSTFMYFYYNTKKDVFVGIGYAETMVRIGGGGSTGPEMGFDDVFDAVSILSVELIPGSDKYNIKNVFTKANGDKGIFHSEIYPRNSGNRSKLFKDFKMDEKDCILIFESKK